MNELTISDVKQKKLELEAAITILLNKFSEETGVAVETLFIEHVENLQGQIVKHYVGAVVKM